MSYGAREGLDIEGRVNSICSFNSGLKAVLVQLHVGHHASDFHGEHVPPDLGDSCLTAAACEGGFCLQIANDICAKSI